MRYEVWIKDSGPRRVVVKIMDGGTEIGRQRFETLEAGEAWGRERASDKGRRAWAAAHLANGPHDHDHLEENTP